MPFYSPMRYPGGKRRLTTFVMQLLALNGLRQVQYAEPYAGGASLALALLFEEYASTVHINDLSRPVYAFWYSVLYDTEELCRKIQSVDITIAEWKRQRSIYDARNEADLTELGFATFFLNRTNRSGIIGGGVIGGKGQVGAWSLDARFTKEELMRRIRRIGRYRDRIKIYNQDGIAFTKGIVGGLGKNVFVFYDPPYIEKGQQLYLNNYDIADHKYLEEQVTQLEQPWIVTYDYEGAVRHRLYESYPRLAFELSYSAQARHRSKEALFLSEQLVLPSAWRGVEAIRMSARQSAYPVFGKLEEQSKRM